MADNTINIKVRIDDKGNLSVLGKKAKAAGEGLEQTAKGARTADRNLKGAARTSSNTTKNFSKMAQGTGGLVGAYASLAAQIFAISAAFNFLKSAGDLKVLQASQQNYAASTGLAMRVLANDIIDATNAQISFQEASQAAAIGTSAGLNPDQLKQLGTAAKNLSITLGRDVTDSFNRLVRGVTKAEPELLDELGIILRLEDAQREYGLRIGKNAKDLTQFEKSQAVVNKVLEEANRVAAVTPEGVVNQYNQLAKAFDDVLIRIKLVADSVAGPLAKVLTDTPALAIASFLLLLKGPLSAIGINFKEMAVAARESSSAQALAAQKAKAAYESTKITIKSTTAAVREQAAAFAAAGSSSKLLQQFGSGGAMTPQARATIKRALVAAENDYNKHTKITKGIFKGMDIAIVRDFALAMKQMDVAEAGKVASTRKNVALMVSAYASGMALVKTASAWLLTWGSRVLSALGWIGIAVTGIQLLSQHFGWFKKEVDETEQQLGKTRDRLRELNEEFKDFVTTQQKLQQVGRGGEVFANLGEMISMTSESDFKTAIRDYRGFAKAREELEAMEASLEGLRGNARVRREAELGIGSFFRTDQLEEARTQMEDLEKGYTTVQNILNTIAVTDLEGLDQSRALTDLREAILTGESEEAIINLRNETIQYGNAWKELPQIVRDANDAIGTFAQSVAPISQGQQAIEAIDAQIRQIAGIGAGRIVQGFTQEEIDTLTQIANTRATITKFEEQAYRFKLKNLELDQQLESNLRNAQTELKDQITLTNQRSKIEADIENKLVSIDFLKQKINGTDLKQNAANQRTINRLKAEVALLDERLVTNQQNLDVLTNTIPNSLVIRRLKVQSEVKKQYQDTVNLVAKEVGFQKELLGFQQKRAELSLRASERELQQDSAFAFVNEEERVATKRFEVEKALIQDKILQINAEFEIKKRQAEIENQLLRNRLNVSALELRNRAAQPGVPQDEVIALQELAASTEAQALSVYNNLTGQIEVLSGEQSLRIQEAVQSLLDLEAAKNNLSDMNVLATELAETLHSGVKTALTDIFTGKESSLKDAVIGIAQSLLQTVAEQAAQSLTDLIFDAGKAATTGAIIAQAMRQAGNYVAVRISSAITTAMSVVSASSMVAPVVSSIGSPVGIPAGNRQVIGRTPIGASYTNAEKLASMFGLANGGVVKGGFQSYANGGIINQPTVGLVGEGRFNEAVVPLPNGKAIPVDMKGSGGVTVNVAVNNNGSATTSVEGAEQQSANFGKAIAMAVQKEIQNQKRSGGMLSPYGVA